MATGSTNVGGNEAAAKELWFQNSRDRRLSFTALCTPGTGVIVVG